VPGAGVVRDSTWDVERWVLLESEEAIHGHFVDQMTCGGSPRRRRSVTQVPPHRATVALGWSRSSAEPTLMEVGLLSPNRALQAPAWLEVWPQSRAVSESVVATRTLNHQAREALRGFSGLAAITFVSLQRASKLPARPLEGMSGQGSSLYLQTLK
jgi:hypothetical protein